MTRLTTTKAALLVTACSLASLSFAQTAPAADASISSPNGVNSQASNNSATAVKTESGLLNTSVQSQHNSQNQLGLTLTKPFATTPDVSSAGINNSTTNTTT